MIHFKQEASPATMPGVSIASFDSFVPGNTEDGNAEPGSAGPSAFWFIIRGSDLLVSRDGIGFEIPRAADPAELGLGDLHPHFLGTLDGAPCRAAGVAAHADAPAGWSFEGVRSLFGMISDSFLSVAARALQIVEWDVTHRFCGACGKPTALKAGERALECTACGRLNYPRISPAVIVAVVREGQILLARAHRFPPGLYSVLAGFVEPGETLEQCVHREVLEETGIKLRNLRYFDSQPWPFPHSLMIAFTAEHAAGEIRVDPEEIVDAHWFSPDALPHIPDPITVARRLIDWFMRTGGRRESR
jgi:NAD+ diphosphatase